MELLVDMMVVLLLSVLVVLMAFMLLVLMKMNKVLETMVVKRRR